MATFNPKESFVGIDIGTSSIKVVQMASDTGRPRLMTYGYLEQRTDMVKSEAPAQQQAIAEAIKMVMRQSGINTVRTVAALPSYAVFSSIISLPLMTKKELNSAVRWEAKKFVPMPIDDLVLDWKLLKEPTTKEDTGKAPKNLRVLITAAPRTLVQRYNAIFKALGLHIEALDTEAFALERSLVGNDPMSVMIVDIGAMATGIAVLVDGIPVINRSIDVGGDTITKSIAQSLNLDLERAEQFKRDFGISFAQQNVSQVPKTVEFILGSVINEIRFVLNLYRAQNTQPVERIILSGGTAFLLNLPQYLERTLTIKTFIGDPWARVVYPVELKPILAEIGPRFAVAIGLAMREIVT